MRLKLKNKNLENGPCRRPVCNFFTRVLAKNVKAQGGNWQRVITDESDLFGDFTELERHGEVQFIMFQLFTRNLSAQGRWSVTNFEVFGEHGNGEYHTEAPSTSVAPSFSPTNLMEEHVGYVVKYGKHGEEGEIRTVVRAPFQIDKTGQVLSMLPHAKYQLCEVDEVEGRKAEASH